MDAISSTVQVEPATARQDHPTPRRRRSRDRSNSDLVSRFDASDLAEAAGISAEAPAGARGGIYAVDPSEVTSSVGDSEIEEVRLGFRVSACFCACLLFLCSSEIEEVCLGGVVVSVLFCSRVFISRIFSPPYHPISTCFVRCCAVLGCGLRGAMRLSAVVPAVAAAVAAACDGAGAWAPWRTSCEQTATETGAATLTTAPKCLPSTRRTSGSGRYALKVAGGFFSAFFVSSCHGGAIYPRCLFHASTRSPGCIPQQRQRSEQ